LRVRVRETSLADLMNEKDDLGEFMREQVNARINDWGMTCNWIYVASIAPESPELVHALEAPFREQLLEDQDYPERDVHLA